MASYISYSRVSRSQVETRKRPLRHIVNKMFLREGYSLTVNELAKAAGLSSRHFSRRFKAETGYCLVDYRRNHRIQRIVRTLVDRPDLPLTRLAYQFDYFDQSHFIRDFKRVAGMSPGKFARSLDHKLASEEKKAQAPIIQILFLDTGHI